MSRPRRMPVAALAGGLAAGAVVLAGLQLFRGIEYWDYSEGVYALSSRLLLHGADLYGHVYGAQPPGLFVSGAGLLAIYDSIEWLRLAVGGLQLVAGLLAAVAVWRLTLSRWAAGLTPAVFLLTPWAIHQHGLLVPEAFAPPLLLGAALLASGPATVPAAAVLAGLAPAFKLPFLLPAVTIVVLSAAPRRAAAWAAGTLVLWAGVATLVFGGGLWEDVVLTQLGSGRRGLGEVARIWAQAGWNLFPLMAAAALAVGLRHRVRDRGLLGVLTGLAAASLATLVTNFKTGTSLSVLAPIEAALVPLAVAGIWVAVTESGFKRDRLLPAAVAVAVLGVAVQSATLLASPGDTAKPFLYPTAERGAWGRVASEAEVRAVVAGIRDCPPEGRYPGHPYYAYLAERPVPDQQPDGFMTQHSPDLRDIARRMATDGPFCP